MSKKTGIAILLLLVAAALAAGVIFTFNKSEDVHTSAAGIDREDSKKAKEKAGGDSVVKEPEEKLKEPVIAVEEKTPEEIAEEAVENVAEEIGWEEAVEEAPAVEEPPVEQPMRTRRGNVTEDLGRMNPLGGGQLPTKEEAIDAAWDVLNAYREASPEEKRQIATQLIMAQGMLNGFAQNAGALIQQVPPERREEIINTASASIDLLAAVQEA